MILASLLALAAVQDPELYLGADLSYVNEMEDCGAVYRKGGKPIDPFALLKAEGGNIVRVRIWNDAKWTPYSDYDDVLKTIRRAHAAGLKVLLDFHYSDDWADGDKQHVPAAWAKLSTEDQAKALYAYTRDILARLHAEDQLPEMVQVGNETNGELMAGEKQPRIDWKRNALLFNAGLKAMRDAGAAADKPILSMLHIAQPENVIGWFDAAHASGVTDYDLIGISYYRKWSTRSIPQLGETVAQAKKRFGKGVILVETAYPFTNGSADMAHNLLGPDTLIQGYPATPEGQRDYLIDVTRTVIDNGGLGTIYWEPGWISTGCKTRWGTGSNWENAAWFDLQTHEALPAFEFLRHDYRSKRPK